MYVCLCNGISDKKKSAGLYDNFIHSHFNSCVNLFLWEINVVSVFAPREVMQDELTQMPEFKEIA